MKQADLQRILTTEERNVLVMVSRTRGADELRLAARSLQMTPAKVHEVVERAKAKIERETRKGGRGVTTAIEEVRCLCGERFTPRRKGELLCPACRVLNGGGALHERRADAAASAEHGIVVSRNGDGEQTVRETAHETDRKTGPETGREIDREPAQESAQESAQLGAASGNGTGDHSEMARNPPPARPFMRDENVEQRRVEILGAVLNAGGELNVQGITAATGILKPTVQNDVVRLVRERKLVKVDLGRRRCTYRTPEYHATFEPEPTAAESEVKGQEMLDGRDDAATPEAPELPPPPSWRYRDEPKPEAEPMIHGQVMDGAPESPAPEPDPEHMIHAPGDGWLHSDGEPDEEALHDERADDRPTVIDEPGVEPPALDVLRGRAAELAQQLMAEAEKIAEMADAAVPETLLRARYIAALLHRIEAGDTSPELLDRFERLAFNAD
jgi:hypothetical protein